jgi:hypothetical protein
VAALPEVQHAKKNSRILVGHGTTNVYVAEEILGREKFREALDRDAYISGIIQRGTLCTTPAAEKPPILVLDRGVVEPPAPTMAEMLKGFRKDSLFIKGANAVDLEGNAAAFVGHPEGGTIGWAIGAMLARGIPLLVPVGLEKLIPSVRKAVALCGQQTFDYCQGMRVGLVPLSGGRVVTEIDALKILAGIESHHVASGGCSGSEGAVTLVSEGEPERIRQAVALVESVKGDPPLHPRKPACAVCVSRSPAQPKDYKFEFDEPRCRYEKKADADLPSYLRSS